MVQHCEDAIIRRSNGSIDIDFYARRSARMRREAIAATSGVLARLLAAIVARSAAVRRKPGRSVGAA